MVSRHLNSNFEKNALISNPPISGGFFQWHISFSPSNFRLSIQF